jgi:hypothetical protein
VIGADVVHAKPVELVIRDSAGERFRCLFQEMRGGAAKDEKARWAAWPVSKDAQQREQVRASLDLVDDDQPSEVGQCRRRVVQAMKVGGKLEIEKRDAATRSCRELASQRRLAYLTWPNDGDHRLAPELSLNLAQVSGTAEHAETLYHEI